MEEIKYEDLEFCGLYVKRNLNYHRTAKEEYTTKEALTTGYKHNSYVDFSGFSGIYLIFRSKRDGLFRIWESAGAYGPIAVKNSGYDELKREVEPSVRLKLERVPRSMKKNFFEFKKNVFTKYYVENVFEPLENLFRNPNNTFVNKKVYFPAETTTLDGKSYITTGAQEFELLSVVYNENGLPRFLVKTYNRIAPATNYNAETGKFVGESIGRISRPTEKLSFFGPEYVSRTRDDILNLFENVRVVNDDVKAQMFAEELGRNKEESIYENFYKFHTQHIPEDIETISLNEEVKVDEGINK